MIELDIIDEINNSSLDEIVKYIQNWNVSSYIEMPSEWAAENRYLPAGQSEYPGKIDHSIAPHMIEICDCFHPSSGITQVSVMKSTQSLATTSIEHAMGHAIKHGLHNILYIISSKNIAKVRSSAAIDVLIDNSGLADYIKPLSERMKRKTADNTFYKELRGGRRLMMTSWNSIGDAKSLTWSFIIMDEIDEAPAELKGQGDPEKIFAGRGKTVRNLKIAKISTPTTTTGKIAKNFYEGDQRYYNVPCPHCGEFQVLDIKGMGRDYGLTADSEKIDGVVQIIPESVAYICKFCKALFYEYQKRDIMLQGKWIPTARPVNPAYRSYHISNLMSPVMFYTWTRAMQEFAETDFGRDVLRFKNFMIDVMGKPWEVRTEGTSWGDVETRGEDYPLGVVPRGGMIITAGVDIQKSWIELVAVAWGEGLEAWIIDHQKFLGETFSLSNPVWTELQKFITNKRYQLGDNSLRIAMTGIDSGYNPQRDDSEIEGTNEHIVYKFVSQTPNCIALRGNDKMKDALIKEVKAFSTSLRTRFDVAVSDFKDEIFSKLNRDTSSPGSIHFSRDLSRNFFRGFCSEVYAETKPGQFNWKKIYERNEPLDCFIGARACTEKLKLSAWTDAVWQAYRNKLKN